jgi:alpha-ketoglutarate-dependent 2,4-dichlorophenoxyacetate dioxygenase
VALRQLVSPGDGGLLLAVRANSSSSRRWHRVRGHARRYDALDDETKTEIEELVCEHSLIYSREAIGLFDLTSEEREHFRPVRHRLVRIDPRTGRKPLFLSAHAGAIVGWTVLEARVFLRDLTEHATQSRFVYRHVWRVGDLVIWDNKTTMHRARRFNSNEIRDVRRTTLAGAAA